MRRKLVQQGAATLMISLPSKWIKHHALKKGDEIELSEAENALVISKEASKIKKQTEITLTNQKESMIRFLILNLYRRGYDRVTVNFKDRNQFIMMEKAIRETLIGFEIISRKEGSFVIENITEPAPEQFDNILNKILYNSKIMIELTIEALEGKESVENYADIMLKIHQFDNFCRRTIMKDQNEKSVFFWNFLSTIVHAPRELYHLNKLLEDNKVKKIKVSKETIMILKEGIDILDRIIQAYQKKDITPLEGVHEKEKEAIYISGFNLLMKKEHEEDIALHFILSAIRNLYLATSPLLGLLI